MSASLVASVQTEGFRAAMRCVASTVAVVTTSADGEWYGMTATSVTSVSASPPSLLVCINQKASLYETIAQAGLFCVNILKVRQVEVGKTFAGALPRRERFAVGEWNENAFGLPVLAGAQAAISCRVAESMSYGTHAIFVGQLLQTSIDELIAPLLYADGRFSSLRETA